jgi:ABC-type glutathione transport system ATPase component
VLGEYATLSSLHMRAVFLPASQRFAVKASSKDETEVTSTSAVRQVTIKAMPQVLLQIRDLTCRYLPEKGKPVVALDNLSLSINCGEVVGILGESGSGKSSLAAAVMRLLPTSAECHGSLFFEEQDLLAMHEPGLRRVRGRSISLIPQDPASFLNPVIRVGTQISEVLRAHLTLDRGERKKRVLQLLQEVGFDDPERIASCYPHQLSGGQRQRIVIAQAIACRPALVIADEPTSKLDSPLQVQILTLMSEISRRHSTTLLWITHDPATLGGFADRIAVMHQGRIVEDGSTTIVLRRPVHSYTRELVGLSHEFVLDSRHAVDGVAYAN